MANLTLSTGFLSFIIKEHYLKLEAEGSNLQAFWHHFVSLQTPQAAKWHRNPQSEATSEQK